MVHEVVDWDVRKLSGSREGTGQGKEKANQFFSGFLEISIAT